MQVLHLHSSDVRMEDPISWAWHFGNVMCGKHWVLMKQSITY
jgi:hypothetical protein